MSSPWKGLRHSCTIHTATHVQIMLIGCLRSRYTLNVNSRGAQHDPSGPAYNTITCVPVRDMSTCVNLVHTRVDTDVLVHHALGGRLSPTARIGGPWDCNSCTCAAATTTPKRRHCSMMRKGIGTHHAHCLRHRQGPLFGESHPLQDSSAAPLLCTPNKFGYSAGHCSIAWQAVTHESCEVVLKSRISDKGFAVLLSSAHI